MAVRKEEVRVTADVSNFVTKMAAAGAAAGGFADRLDAADSRMSNLVQTGLALAPALVPLGAAATPALVGLANGLGIATLAAGTAVLAFHGVGDSLKAIDAYKADPTAANFAKLQRAMDKLGPAGQEFSLFLDNLKPKLQQVQNVAEQGLLPGVQEGLQQLLPLLPEVNRVVFAVSSTLGDLVSSGARDLRSNQWQAFFSFLEADASTTLVALGKATGNVAKGFAELWQAFSPLIGGFNQGFLSMSRSFEQWAAGLSQTQGFQNFLNYVQKSGPQALHALAAIGNALLQIVEAAAPVGSVALPAITAIANAVSSLADSSVGPTLIAVAAAVGVLGRSLSLLQTVGLRGGQGFFARNYVTPARGAISAFRDLKTASADLTAAERDRYAAGIKARSATASKAEISGYIASQREVATTTERVAEAERTKSAAIRAGAGAFAKGAAGAAGLALATSGLADHFGLSNTASLALIGTIAGPWGAAIGGGIGLVKDFASANDNLESAVQASGRAISAQTVDFTNMQGLLRQTQSAAADYQRQVSKPITPLDFAAPLLGLAQHFTQVTDLFSHSGDKSRTAIDKQRQSYIEMGQTASDVYAQLNHGSLALTHASTQQLTAFANQITPALTQAGINVDKFMHSVGGSSLRLAGLKAIRTYFDSFNSASGKSRAVAAALAALGSQMSDDVTQAQQLKAAMDSLFGVELNQSAATDAWTSSLRDLHKQLAGTNGAIVGNSAAALANRASIRSSVSALEDKITADAAAGVSGDKLVGTLIRGRQALIRQGAAAGVSRKQMNAYLNTLGLTPKNLTTIITADGALTAQQKVQALAKVYGLTPKQVHTVISAIGAGKSEAQIRSLLKTYGLTPKQITTLLKAIDQASAKAKAAKKAGQDFAKAYKAYLNADDNASGKSKTARATALAFAKKYLAALLADNRTGPGVAAARALVNSLRDKTITITTNYVTHGGPHPGHPLPGPPGSAAGNIFRNFAAGDIANAHQPVIERMPKYRMWAEPETKGEAYIPLANDWRRPRAVSIWEETGRLLGQMASGGMWAQQPMTTMSTVSRDVIVNFNAPVNGTDANELARKAAQRVQTAAAMTAAMP